MSSYGLVSVIIVTRNRRRDIVECLASVLESTYSPLEIIVVDNASIDDTLSVVRATFKNVILIPNEKNLGLAEARNIGQRMARGNYLLFLDSDTVVEPNMIENLVCHAGNPKVGIVAPKMYNYFEPQRLWFAGATFDLLSSRAKNTGAWELDVGKYDRPSEISHAPTCLLLRKELADRIGGHDPLFFQSYADTDLAFRLHKLGCRNEYSPKAVLYHKVPPIERMNSLRGLGIDSPMRAYYYARNKTIFMKRHANRVQFLAFIFVFLPIVALAYVRRIAAYGGGVRYLSSYIAGLRDGIGYIFRKI